MGHTASTPEEPITPPDEYARRRQEYIHRLGIKRDGPCRVGRPHARMPSPYPTYMKDEMIEMESEEANEGDPDTIKTMRMRNHSPYDKAGKENFRMNFLSKLSYEHVWVPKALRPPSHQTCIIFDWDDTLLCTSYLMAMREYGMLPPDVEDILEKTGKVVAQLLETSLRLGQTWIITNARPTWVQYTAAKYIPEVLPTLEKIRVISARGRHEQQYPNEVHQWKTQAFLDVKREMDSETITNLISLGDSTFEIYATHEMAKEFSTALVKTVKFQPNPCPEALLKQLELVATKLEKIVESARNMKVSMERKPGH